MPFVTVTAGASNHPTPTAELAARIAGALDLALGDVYVAHVLAADSSDGAGARTPFAVVDVRGRRRAAEDETAAARVASATVAELWHCPPDAVWVQWHHPE